MTLAKNAIRGAGGEFEGNDETGEFRLSTPVGSVKGNFTIEDSTLVVNISDKPMFITCSKIEKEIRKYLDRH